MSRILLVEDDQTTLSILATLLRAEGHNVEPLASGVEASERIRTERFDLIVTDIFMSPVSGRDILRLARETAPDSAVIMLTAHGSVETAIEALKLGAFDYVTKPFKVDELLITVQHALEYQRAMTENLDLRSRVDSGVRFASMVAESGGMRRVCDMIERVAPTDAAVLIHGESGTGKELVARAIHDHSRRSAQRFIAINCAALPEALLESELFGHVKGAFTGAISAKEGLFEAARSGTLFLDEISAMPVALQSKLLRVLQEKEVRRVGSNENIAVDARILAATNVKLEILIAEGKFREDLYYRLSVIPIHIPPLRERQEDILPLVSHFLRRETGEGQEIPRLDPKVCRIFSQYPWPGNVRELENAIKHALMFCQNDTLTTEGLPPRILDAIQTSSAGAPTTVTSTAEAFRGQSLKRFLRTKEEEYLKQVLSASGGDKQKAAEALKISLATLYRKLPVEPE